MQEFLAKHQIKTKTEVNAKKEQHQLAKAKSLLKSASTLIAAKGKKVTTVDLKTESLSDEEITKLMLGPTGNLRAPTLVVGKSIFVGFNGRWLKLAAKHEDLVPTDGNHSK